MCVMEMCVIDFVYVDVVCEVYCVFGDVVVGVGLLCMV